MAITNYDGIIAARAGSNYWDWYEATTTVIGGVTTSWYCIDSLTNCIGRGNPITGMIPLSAGGHILNAVDLGAIPIPYSGASSRYLTTIGVNTTSIVGFTCAILCDYLWTGAFVNLATSKTTTLSATGAPTLTRYGGLSSAAQSSIGNQILVDVEVVLGGTPGTFVINYYDSNGVLKSTPSITPAAVAINRAWANTTNASPFVTLADNKGVSKIQSITLGTGTSPTGSINISIVRPLLTIPFVLANTYIERDSTINIDGLLELVKGTDSQHGYLSWLVLTGGTTTAAFAAMGRTVVG